MQRRRVDWNVIMEGRVPAPKLVRRSVPPPQLSTLVRAAGRTPSRAAADRVLRHAVELCRLVVQFERTAIFLVDAENNAMVGTWGTDDRGETVDEHNIAYEFGLGDRAVFERSQRGLPWTVYENCPLVMQTKDETRILGRGWVACTAILGPRGPLGILFNDTALTHAPVDEAKQARAALLCSLLGQALDGCRRHLIPPRRQAPAAPSPNPSEHPLVRRVTKALTADPALTCEQLGSRVHMSAARVARAFKRETNTSVVAHRNELRLARFLERVDARAHNLLEAALDAGFGSYAQFHRVFRARFGLTPRAYFAADGDARSPHSARPRADRK